MPELSLIEHFRRFAPSHPWMTVGPGQDCAALRWDARCQLAFKIDQVVEGTHFLRSGREAATPRQIAWKAMAKTCSDIAAAGCRPVAAMVSVNLPRGSSDRLAKELYAGITACCRKYAFALAGGDLAASGHGLSLSVAMLGSPPRGEKIWTRDGARPGDVLLLSGPLGGSRAGRHLRFQPRLGEAQTIRALAKHSVHACIDVTDGLSRDLHHLCRESGVGARIDADAIPTTAAARAIARKGGASALLQALRDGEDFELLLAVAPAAAATLLGPAARRRGLNLKRIGTIQKNPAMLISLPDGVKPLADMGYEHRT